MSTLSPSKHTDMIKIRFIYLYCLAIVFDNDQSIFSLASPFSHKFVAFKLISYLISILLLYLNSGINSRISSIARFMDLASSCFVWFCEASIESLPEICCFADEWVTSRGFRKPRFIPKCRKFETPQITSF